MIRYAWILLLAAGPAFAQAPEQRAATVAYLQSLQTPEGAFRPSKAPDAKPGLRATSAAIRALKYFDGELKNRDACVQFVENCFDRRGGGFVDAPGGTGDVFTAAVGAMAVVELKLPKDVYAPGVVRFLNEHAKSFEELRIAAAGFEALGEPAPKAEVWRAEILRGANADGSFGKADGLARDTGGAAAALLRLGHKFEKPEALVAVLRTGQRDDGGFGKPGEPSDLETTYRVMRAFVMLKAKPKDLAKLRSFIAARRTADGGYSVAKGQPATVPATYYAGILLHWMDHPRP